MKKNEIISIKNPIHKGCGGKVLYCGTVIQYHSINLIESTGNCELNSVEHCHEQTDGIFVCDKCDEELSIDEMEEEGKENE